MRVNSDRSEQAVAGPILCKAWVRLTSIVAESKVINLLK